VVLRFDAEIDAAVFTEKGGGVLLFVEWVEFVE